MFSSKSPNLCFIITVFSELLLKLFKLYDNPFGFGNILFEINSLVFCGVVGLSHSSEAFAWPSYHMWVCLWNGMHTGERSGSPSTHQGHSLGQWVICFVHSNHKHCSFSRHSTLLGVLLISCKYAWGIGFLADAHWGRVSKQEQEQAAAQGHCEEKSSRCTLGKGQG